jgi:HEAT repeat protein
MEDLFFEEEKTFEELVELARAGYEAEGDESGEYWDIVWILAGRREGEMLPLAQGDAFERTLAATVLARIAFALHLSPQPNDDLTPSALVDILLRMLESEKEENPLKALVSSLSRHQEMDERIPPIVKGFYRHPNVAIRWCLAVGLDNYETPEAIEMLIALTTDEDEEIRNWATSNLETQVHLDSPEIRAALLARLDDENAETRAEALYGLAKRKDARVVPAVLREFEASSSEASASSELFDALAALPGYGLALALQNMADDADYGGDREELQRAIEQCEAYAARGELELEAE